MFFPFGPIPEEVKRQMEEAHDRQRAETEAWHNEQNDFFDGMSKDQLVTLNRILRNMGEDLSGRTAAFYEGIVQSLLTFKHKVCPSCGIDHAEEFTSGLGTILGDMIRPLIPKVGEPLNLPPGHEQLTFDDALKDADMSVEETVDLAEELHRKQQMERYNVEPDAENPPFLKCRGCGLTYVSLEDRMVKAANDCHGCAHKSKWG